MAKLTARDFKNTRREPFDLRRHKDFGLGLGLGLIVAVLAFVQGQRSTQAERETGARPEPRKTEVVAAVEAAEARDAATQYDFYEMLPQFEVVVPEKEPDVKRDMPTARVERPGVYVLQAGSYRNLADAERVSAQLARQGIAAAVQRVAVDADVWHRVRVGPVTDLEELNRLRSQLRAAEIDALVIRVGE
jgi:cell division protein FtsN